MVTIIRDSAQFVNDLVDGITPKNEWVETEAEFINKAKSALMPVKDDALYLAQLFRKYDVQKESYDYKKSFSEMAAPLTPLKEEVRRYSEAKEAVTIAIMESGLSLMGAHLQISHALIDFYFKSEYQLPDLE